MKYRTKPAIIEAIRFLGGFSFDEMAVEWGKDFTDKASYNHLTNTLTIRTLEGDHLGLPGDYIIKGLLGEFYPCKPKAFERKYEPVDEVEK